ncbi:MAG TPA: flagellar protein FlgN [Steroidobacteraceae bacterium]|nr:flagellar protein FlgN [Steroidobacteraceae bacterium]
MDANLCRQHVERLLSEEIGLMVKLQTLLDREFMFINSNDVESLEEAGEFRQACTGDLVRVEDERRSLCRMAGKGADLAGLDQLMKWCDPKGTLQSRWTDCAAHATRCRELNDRNGLVVSARLQQVSGMLNLITGRNNAPATYGPAKGAYGAAPATGRMFRSEA